MPLEFELWAQLHNLHFDRKHQKTELRALSLQGPYQHSQINQIWPTQYSMSSMSTANLFQENVV